MLLKTGRAKFEAFQAALKQLPFYGGKLPTWPPDKRVEVFDSIPGYRLAHLPVQNLGPEVTIAVDHNAAAILIYPDDQLLTAYFPGSGAHVLVLHKELAMAALMGVMLVDGKPLSSAVQAVKRGLIPTSNCSGTRFRIGKGCAMAQNGRNQANRADFAPDRLVGGQRTNRLSPFLIQNPNASLSEALV